VDTLSLLSEKIHSMPANLRYLTILAGAVVAFSIPIAAQEPSQPAPASQPVSQQPPPSSESTSKQKANKSSEKHSDDFLVRGTVFTAEGFGFPGAELRIRRASEKKIRWETVSNSRGDFAVRVKMGTDYQVTVRAKGFQEQTVPVDAKTGERYKDLVFRMEREGGKK
jgi:Carboxypeptidase regulatory-like domain